MAVLVVAVGGVWARRLVADFWQRVRQGLAILREPSRYFRHVVLWQALDWSLRLAGVFFFLAAFGIPADLRDALAVQVTHNLSTVLPLTPAGIGTEQALALYVLAGEASRTAVLSFSVGMKLIVIAVNVVLGFGAIALMLRTVRWGRVVQPEQLPTRTPPYQ